MKEPTVMSPLVWLKFKPSNLAAAVILGFGCIRSLILDSRLVFHNRLYREKEPVKNDLEVWRDGSPGLFATSGLMLLVT